MHKAIELIILKDEVERLNDLRVSVVDRTAATVLSMRDGLEKPRPGALPFDLYKVFESYAPVRKRAKERDGGICAVCGFGGEVFPDQIDEWRFRNQMDRRMVKSWHHAMGFAGSGGVYWHAHHIKPLSSGGLNNLKNVVTLCISCHREAHSEIRMTGASSCSYEPACPARTVPQG